MAIAGPVSMTALELAPPPVPGFFMAQGEGVYLPTEATIGPWAAHLQHGGPPAALLTHALRTFPSAFGLQLARLTIEILAPVPLLPCTLSVRVLRPGKRIELLEGELCVDGKPALLARAWRVERLPGSTTPVADDFVMPVLPEAQPQQFFAGVGDFPYARSLEWRFNQGGYAQLGPATLWTRARLPLIAGQPLHPLEALVLMLDSANGVSAELDIRQWSFVPVDMTLNLARLPHGEWQGMAARTVIADDGIGMAHTTVFDEQGALGRSQHTLFIRPR